MGSYDFGSWEVHFYSHDLWSSPSWALKTFLHICLWPHSLWLTNLLVWLVSFPQHRDFIWVFGDISWALRAVLFYCQWEWVPLVLTQCQGPLVQTLLELFCTAFGPLEEKGLDQWRPSLTALLITLTQTEFTLSMLLDYRAGSHTRTEAMGYKNQLPI